MILTQHQLKALALNALCIILLSLPSAISIQAQDAPKARKVIDRAVIAMGGKEKLKAITSREAYGSIKRLSDGATGKVEFITRQPNAYFYRINWDKNFEQAGYNGISGYQWNSDKRGEFLSGLELELLQAEADDRNGYWYHDERNRFYSFGKFWGAILTLGLGRLSFDYAITEGKEQWLGISVNVVGFRLTANTKASLYFDEVSGYLVGEKLYAGKVTKQYEYDDFRPVNGIIEPHFIRMKTANDTFEIKLDQIAFNQSIETVRFEIPLEAQPKLPNLTDVVAQARANQEKVVKNYDQLKYVWNHKYEKEECYEITEHSNHCSTSTYQDELDVSFYRGYLINTKHYSDAELMRGGPFGTSLEDITLSRIDAAKRKIDAKIQKLEKKGKPVAPDEGLKEVDWFWGRGIANVLRYAKFSNLRPARYQERDFYLIDFFPTPGEKNDPEKSIDSIGGTLWIDAQSMFVEKMETRSAERYKGNLKQQVYGFSNGIWSSVKQERFCDDLWLPTSGKAGSDESVFRNYTLKDGRPVCDAQNKSQLK